jgi:ketosteroid isomerase-like protein
VERETALELLRRLHTAQGEFYLGGEAGPVRALLAEDVVWRVPGRNAIAGEYRGVDAVMDYFARRRDLAERSFRLHPGEVLVGELDHVGVLTDGTATIDGVERRWSTLGLYRVREGWIAACWLLPLDPKEFDEIWASPG